jgi:hypothetical protein
VSSFADKAGNDSWIHVKGQHDVQNKESAWRRGDEKGNFGETPLHIAIHFNKPSDELTDFFFELWDMCPASLQLSTYTNALYKGENVLHIATTRRRSTQSSLIRVSSLMRLHLPWPLRPSKKIGAGAGACRLCDHQQPLGS